jgi:alkaline phosphatase
MFNRRYDNLNLVDSLRQRGYVVSARGTGFNNLPLDGSRPFVNFTNEMEPPTASAGRTYLPRATRLACDFLAKRSEKGFFLMVEGSQIDWASHTNDHQLACAPKWPISIRLYKRRWSLLLPMVKPLSIVTATMSAEVFALTQTDLRKQFKPSPFPPKCTPLPWCQYMPTVHKRQLFSGVYENTEIYFKMFSALGFESFK